MKHVFDLLSLVGGTLEKVAKSDVVAGAPITLGGVTLVPISRVSVGMGCGGGQGEGQAGPVGKGRAFSGEGLGGGAGAGGRIRPAAVAVFGENGVQILPIPEEKGTWEKLFDKVPDLIDRVKQVVADAKGNADEEEDED